MKQKRGQGCTSPTRKSKYKAHYDKLDRKKRLRKEKWDRDRLYWKNNKKYQEKQVKRALKIKGKEK